MPKPRYPHVYRETTRHGRHVWYFRRGDGPRTRLPDEYGSEVFISAYNLALAGTPTKNIPNTNQGSLGWLISRYRDGSSWSSLAQGTRVQRESVLKALPHEAPLAALTRKAIIAGMDRRKPDAANVFLFTLRHLFEWAVYAEHVKADPTIGVKRINVKRDGFHVWTDDEIGAFEGHWPIGTRERLAFDLLLYTGSRRSDAVLVGRQHVRDGHLRFYTSKGRVEVVLPILAPLARSIEATQTGDMTFICTARGLPMDANVFTVWFRNAAKLAGCPGSAHGLRKASATRMAEAGGTTSELKASYGWKTNAMPELYTKTAERAEMAIRGMAKLERKK